MSGGGSTNTTVTNSSIPKEFYDELDNILTRGEAASLEPYQPYQGQRIADTSADTNASYDMVRNMATNGMPMTQQAGQMTQGAYSAIGQAGAGGPYQYSQFGYSDPTTFSGDAIGQYMSPYMQRVVDAQKASALEDFQMANGARAAQAVNAGAFGGSRAAIQQGLAERDLLSRTNQIEAQGLQDSFDNAMSMFEKDRAAKMATEQARAAELSRVQQGQAGENFQYAGLDMDKAKAQAAMADQMSLLEQRARAGDVQAAQLLEAAGKSQQAQQQASLDTGYQDYLRQLGYPMEQLKDYASLLFGAPLGTSQTTTTPAPNPYAQALGTGISALGLYNAYSGA